MMAIKEDLMKNREEYPQITTLLESTNQILRQFGQRTVLF